MAKGKTATVFFCQNCGYESTKWLGQCPGCREWNTFVEETIDKTVLKNTGTIELDDGSIHHLSAKKWNSVIRAGLKSCGYLVDQRVSNVTIRPCECVEQVC